jgi:peptide alpha-N-acetyltransferase
VVAVTKDNFDVWIAVYDIAIRRKKYLQAARALSHARSLSPEHPELHIRTVDMRKTVSSLPQVPPTPIGPVLTELLSSILPDEISLETFNSQYLQRHSSSAAAVLAAAKVSRKLDATREEVEDILFTTLKGDIQLDIKTAHTIISFLGDIQSPRQDEYRAACDTKFELSTIFKTSSELAVLRKDATKGDIADETDKLEVVG